MRWRWRGGILSTSNQWQPYEAPRHGVLRRRTSRHRPLCAEGREKELREALVNLVTTSAQPARRTSNTSPLTRHSWLKALHEARNARQAAPGEDSTLPHYEALTYSSAAARPDRMAVRRALV